ncbi:MAG: rRNA pseudouridine synthase [Bacteroidales bacterium]|nr:rRNA pseudouridine synthase [Bacteroidales bacterium]
MEKERVLRPRRKRIGESGGERPAFHNSTPRSEGYRSEAPRKEGFRSDAPREGGFRKSGFAKPGFKKEGGYGSKPAFKGSKPSFKKAGGRKGGYKPYGDDLINKMIDERKKQFGQEALSDSDSAPIPVKEVVRLNKFMANSGICSRREADTYIQAGIVTVNGEVVTELGTKVNIYTDEVRFNGERLKGEEKVYILMNKPRGYVTTTADPHAEKTVMELLRGCRARVFSVGRLDKNTTGVLMFTNDGEMAEKLTHPSYDKKKIYQVTLDKEIRQEDFDQILSGIELSDGPIAADDLQYIDAADKRKLGIEIHSGKNRIVRRIFEHMGYEVHALDRVYFAGLTKKGLKRGEWRFLTEGEVNILKMGAYK